MSPNSKVDSFDVSVQLVVERGLPDVVRLVTPFMFLRYPRVRSMSTTHLSTSTSLRRLRLVDLFPYRWSRSPRFPSVLLTFTPRILPVLLGPPMIRPLLVDPPFSQVRARISTRMSRGQQTRSVLRNDPGSGRGRFGDEEDGVTPG